MRTHARMIDHFHHALLALALAQTEPHGGCVRKHMPANGLFGVLHERHAARWVSHDLIGDDDSDVVFL